MKKVFFLICILFVPLLESCEKEVIYDSTYSATYDLRPGDWTSGDGYFTVALDVREITRAVCKTGSVQCFIVYDEGTQSCLPVQRYLSYDYDNPDTGMKEIGFYQKMIDFEYSEGVVNLFYTISDFYYESYPEAMTIRVVVHY